MLESVYVEASHGKEILLPLTEVSSGIILANIQGLEPTKATLTSTNFAMRDGTTFQAARRESRDIILQMRLDSRYGGESIAAIRRELYEVFMPKTELQLSFSQSDFPTTKITGRIEDVESPRFTQNPYFAVSIHCNDPDFVDPEYTIQTGEAYGHTMSLRDVEYVGNVDSGIELQIDITVSGTSSGFVLQQNTPRGDTRRLIFDTPLQSRDRIYVNTHPGEKEVEVARDGSRTSILYAIDPQSEWAILESGTNQIGVQVTGETLQSYYEFKWFDRYGGL